MLECEPTLLAADTLTPTTLPVLNGYYDDEPIGPEMPQEPSSYRDTNGVLIIGEEYAPLGDDIIFLSDENGKLLGIAFGNGDGTNDDERWRIQNGVGCFGGILSTVGSSGILGVVGSASIAAYSCYEFVRSFQDRYAPTDITVTFGQVNFTDAARGFDYAFKVTYHDGKPAQCFIRDKDEDRTEEKDCSTFNEAG